MDLFARLIRHAEAGTGPALVASGRASLDYGQIHELLRERIPRFAHGLLPARSRIAVSAADPAAVLTWTLAALAGGHDVLLIPPETPDIPGAASRAGALMVCGDRDVQGWTGAGAEQETADGAEPSVHFLTSGTSGRPKTVSHSLTALTTEASTVASHLGYRPEKRVLCPVPLCHAYGFVLGTLACLVSGATLVKDRCLTRRSFERSLGAHRPEVVVAVPRLYEMWCEGRPGVRPEGTLRLCVSSGAMLPGATADRFTAVWGTRIAEQYGSSECGVISINLDRPGEPGCVGHPYPGVEVKAGSRQVPRPIVVRSRHAAHGYAAGADEPGTDVFAAAGIATGDLGWVDDEGRLYILGRRSDLISVHGRKVDAHQVEAVLAACDGVDEAAVAGVDTANGDQWICAFTAPAPGPGEAVLAEWCARRLAPWQRPRRFVSIPRIPRTPTGKVRTGVLLDLARSRRAAGASPWLALAAPGPGQQLMK
jgi:long-chain acyl-CoA synthetase